MTVPPRSPTRYVVQALRRALDELQLEYVVQEPPGKIAVVDFEVPYEDDLFAVRALELENELVTFYVQAELEIPDDRLDELIQWVLRMNAGLPLGTFELDPDDHELRVRHSVDCVHIPEEALTSVLRHAIAIIVHTWSKALPAVLGVLGQELEAAADVGDEDDDDDAAAGGGGAAEPRVYEGEYAWRNEYRVRDDMDPEDPLGLLEDTLHHAIVEAYSGEMADMLLSTLVRLAARFRKRMLAVGRGSEPMRAEVLREPDAMPALVVRAEGVAPLRFWFDASVLEQRLELYCHRYTLYHHARPEEVQHCLTRGFTDAVVTFPGDFTLDEHGVPVDAEPERQVQGVLLTDRPLPPDDRDAHSVVLRLPWSVIASAIDEHEQFEVAYTGADARLLLGGLRRWCVPADEVNFSIRERRVRPERDES
ncbi:MAG TPA: YbjN domain-containing protein [Gemmatimonadaceae bacterium]|nr:YbjN domain-containing protein [Gemmatimonadaceae bacterium]